MERNELVKVDIFDNEIGLVDKATAHREGILHRAFSVYLINDKNEILIQKRASDKYHSPNLWANSCCSHPRQNEDVIESAIIRLVDECNIHIDELEELFKFNYMAKFSDCLYEYEVDHVLLGRYNGEVVLNQSEASEYRWISLEELNKELSHNPHKYTVWFLMSAPRVIEILKQI